MMKNLLILLMSTVFFFTISCRKDNDNNSEEITSVEGIWTADKVVVSGSISVSQIPVPVPINEVRDNACTQLSTVVFNADGTGSMLIKDDLSGTCSEMFNQDFTYIYDAQSNTLEISGSGSLGTADVTTLSSTELVLEQEVQDLEIQGNSFSGTITVYLKK